MKLLLTKPLLLLFITVYAVIAVEPNYVKTTTYSVGIDIDASNNPVSLDMTSISYSNGLGQAIQTKEIIASDSDRVVCSFYDEAGRLKNTTKPFIDKNSCGSYLPGNLTDVTIGNVLKTAYNNDTRAYSEIEYWDDPLGRAKKSLAPGDAHVNEYSRGWTIGVALKQSAAAFNPYDVTYSNGTSDVTGTVAFNDSGFIEKVTLDDQYDPVENLLDALYTAFTASNPFSDPDFFLTIVLDPEKNISQERKDLFGRTIETYVDTVLTNTTYDEALRSSYHYDITGNVLNEVAPTQGATKLIDDSEYKYNTLGQLIWKKTPDGGEFLYDYTPDGQIDTVKSIINTGTIEVVRKLSYHYDELGRLRYIRNWDMVNNTNDPVLKNFYDAKEDILRLHMFQVVPAVVRDKFRNHKGRLVGRVNSASGISLYEIGELFSYDDEGRLETKIMVMGNSDNWQSTHYKYDLHGKVFSEYFQYSGDVIYKEYSYDRFGRLDTVYHFEYDPAQDAFINKQPIATYAYNELRGMMESKKFDQIPTDHSVVYSYDILDRLKTMNMNSASGNGFSENGLTYTAAGNITNANYQYSVGGAVGDSTFTYQYDKLYRLAGATLNSNSTYGSYNYDNLGRFLTKEENGRTVDTYNYYKEGNVYTNRLKSTSRNNAGVGYIYDKHGNMVVDISKNLVIRYDWRDMPIEYLFYDNLSGITFSIDNGTGTYNGTTDLYAFVAAQSVTLVSTVTMFYDADGNRVCKLEEKM